MNETPTYDPTEDLQLLDQALGMLAIPRDQHINLLNALGRIRDGLNAVAIPQAPPKRRGGRPKGSKNKPKPQPITAAETESQ